MSRYEPDGTFQLDNVALMDEAKNYQAYCRPADIKDWNHKLPLPPGGVLYPQRRCLPSG